MSEPPRLLEDPKLRSLLASAERDRPSDAARERALGVLGIAGTASIAPGAAAAKATWASIAKIAGIATASTVAVAGAVHYMTPAAPPEPAPIVAPAPTPTEEPRVVLPPPPVESASVEPPPPATANIAAPKPKPSVTDELAILDRAQTALRDKNSKAALAALDEHDARFPKGAFEVQSGVLRIEALAQAGNMDAARARGHAFLADHPKAPEAARVRSLIGE